MEKFTTRLTLDVMFEVELEMGKYVPANLSGHPDSWSPEEGGEVNVLSIKIVDCQCGKPKTIGKDIADFIGKGLLDELTCAAVDEIKDSNAKGEEA